MALRSIESKAVNLGILSIRFKSFELSLTGLYGEEHKEAKATNGVTLLGLAL